MPWMVLVLLLAGLVVVVRARGAADSLFLFPSREPFTTPPGVRDVLFQTEDGLTLHGWLLLPPGASPQRPFPGVLHAHGNAGNIEGHAAFSAFLVERGIAVLVFDYRSYGRSEVPRAGLRRGALMRDTRAAWAALRAQPEIDRARTGVYGVSIGGTFAAALAAEEPEARCLCLAAPFSSWPAIAHAHVPVVGPLIVASGLAPIDSVRRLGARPLLVVHGDRDRIVPLAQGRAVAEAARAAGVPSELRVIAGAEHNDLVADEPEGREAVGAFFARALAENAP